MSSTSSSNGRAAVWGSSGVAVSTWEGENRCRVKTEAQGAGWQASDVETYADMMGNEKKAACKHI